MRSTDCRSLFFLCVFISHCSSYSVQFGIRSMPQSEHVFFCYQLKNLHVVLCFVFYNISLSYNASNVIGRVLNKTTPPSPLQYTY